jgi:hypothetical protein
MAPVAMKQPAPSAQPLSALRPHQHVIPQRQRPAAGGAEDGVLHDDALAPHGEGLAPLGGEHGAVEDARTGADAHVAGDDGGGRHPGAGVDGGTAAAMFHAHGPAPPRAVGMPRSYAGARSSA